MKLNEVDLIGKLTLQFKEIQRKFSVPYTTLIVELSKGIKIETEHTNDLALAREIALDHLSEFPDYYTRLEKVEGK